MLDPELQSERERVAAAARRLAAEGLVLGTAGNVSHRTGGAVLVTPTGGVLETLEAADVAAVEIDGRPLPGSTEPTSEIDLHLGAIVRYGAGAVVHTHSPAATALSCVVDEVPVVHYGMLALGGAVPVAPYHTFGTPELAEAVLDALEGRRAALMASHGAVVYAGDVEEAVELALLLEWACEIYWRASLLGTPRVLGSDEQQAVIAAVLERGYGRR
ncbi:MAG: class II aldolase/adducin family protein [Solirubrobacteraceae bacterium]|jgi:L-fuculose-phosphate aldolase